MKSLALALSILLGASANAGADKPLVAKDGVKLATHSWRPEGTARGVLVVVHGLKDHGARYRRLAARLTPRGVAVHALDLRGHGQSGGKRERVRDFGQYVDDLDQFMSGVRAEYPGVPVFLYGHSMGGAVVTGFAADGRQPLDGLIVSAGALSLNAPRFAAPVIKALGKVVPGLPLLKLRAEDFSRDREEIAAMKNDPLIAQGRVPAGTVGQLVKRMQTTRRRVDEGASMPPLLVMHGTADKVTFGSPALHEAASSPDKQLATLQGMKHDLLHDDPRDSSKVMSIVADWISARLK